MSSAARRDDGETAADGEVVYVSLGSNLGDRDAHLARAVAGLRATDRVDDVELSPVYETDPVGPGEQGPYLNAVVRLRVRCAPAELLSRLQELERAAGRVRGSRRWEARTLDLDVLLFGDRVVDADGLTVPHPRLHERAFVLEPLSDLAPDAMHPLLGDRMADLARRVRDPAAVRRRD